MRATDREHRIGSLFFNPGGPGGSEVDFVREAPASAVALFGRLYDIVGFDPRGVGASRPAVRDCAVSYAGDEFPRPDTADTGALVAAAREQLRRCAAGSGGILPYLTTGNVARDLDMLRAAVGDARLNYVGLSYAALIGETYATLFPGRTGAFVLDSPVDGDVWLNRPFETLREQQASFERSLDRFLHWCSRRERLCALDPEDPRDDFDALVAQLNAAPLPVPGEPPVNGDEVLSVAGGVGGWFLAYIEAGTLPPEGAGCRQHVPEPGAQRAASADDRPAWKRAGRPAGAAAVTPRVRQALRRPTRPPTSTPITVTR